jgi:hypothetical protein
MQTVHLFRTLAALPLREFERSIGYDYYSTNPAA